MLWGCFYFLFKENIRGSLCHQGPSGTPSNMILPEEQRGKFAADQMQRHRERRRGPGVADERALGPTQICVFSQDLRAMNNGESTHSSGCVAVGGVRGEEPSLKTSPRHEEVGRAQPLQAGSVQLERAAKRKMMELRGWSALSCGDSVLLLDGNSGVE